MLQVLFADALVGLKEFRRALVCTSLVTCYQVRVVWVSPSHVKQIKQAKPSMYCMQRYYRQAQQLFHISSLGQVIPSCRSCYSSIFDTTPA